MRDRLLVLLVTALIGWAPTPVEGVRSWDAPSFVAVGDSDVIPDNLVATLAEDAAGLLWIGTASGLIRYDGYRFRLYQHDRTDPHSIGGNFVRALLVASDGRLWIGTEADGLSVYDPANEHFTSFRNDPGDRTSLAQGSIHALAEGQDGAIWVGLLGGGLNRYETSSKRFIRFQQRQTAPVDQNRADSDQSDAARTNPNNDRIESLRIARNGTLWVGSWNGVARLLPGLSQLDPVFSDAANPQGLFARVAWSLYEAQDGQLWVGTQQGDLVLIDPANGHGRRIATAAGVDAGALGPIQAFLQVSSHEMWLGRTTGIEVRDATSGRLLRTLQHEPANRFSISGNDMRALLRDRSGVIWAAGYGSGLQRHNPGNRGILVRGADTTPGGLFLDPNVSGVMALSNGEVWLGTQNSGIVVFDADLEAIGTFRSNPSDPWAIGSDRVRGMAQTTQGTIWVGSGTGIHRFESDRGAFRSYGPEQGLTTVDVRRLFAVRDGDLMVGTSDGLFRVRAESERVDRISVAGDPEVANAVNAMALGADGSLWVGTVHGLFVLSAGASRLQPVPARVGHGLLHESIVGLLLDRQGRLWIDTAEGLHRMLDWDGESARFEDLSTRLGIAGRAFGANLLEDDAGRIWTHQFVYDPNIDSVYELTRADGVNFGTGWFRSYAQTSTGLFLFGGSKGLLVVDPKQFQPWSYAPPVIVTDFKVNGLPRPASSLIGDLTLAPDERSFSVEFAALDFTGSERNRYAFRLDGFDDHWIETDASQRLASYSNLAPGEYRLRVRGSNRIGTWSPQEISIATRVVPAWWQTWWFKLAEVAAALALVYLAMHVRTLRWRRNKRELEQKVRERTAELEQASRYKSEFLANMSHEIRTPMNAVLGLSRLCLGTDLTLKQRDYLEKVFHAGQSLLGIINDVLDISKVEAGKLTMEAISFQLEDVFEDLRSLTSISVEEKGLTLHLDLPSERRRLVGDPLRLKQVLLNLLNNAIKFTERGEINVRVTVLQRTEMETELEFAVCDSGIGLTLEQRGRLFQAFSQADASTTRRFGGTGLGLALSKALVEKMRGTIRVESTPGVGSTFAFTARFARAAGLREDQRQHASAKDWQVGAAAAIRGARVLVVDDSPINQQIAEEWLSQAGLVVELADNGQEAVDRVSAHRFDAVLMDVQMRVMDGYAATRAIRALPAGGEVPIIAATANAMADDRQKCLDAGMNDHVSKPIDPELLLKALQMWIKPRAAIPDLARVDASAALAKPKSATTARAVSSKSLPASLPGIELDLVIKRLAGNVDLVRTLLRMFLRNHSGTVRSIVAAIEQGDIDLAHRLSHTLKGTAGTIGMMEVYRAAEALDSALQARQDDRFEVLVSALIEVFEPVVRGLEQLADEVSLETSADRS